MNAHNCELLREGMKDQAFIPLAWDEISTVEMKLRSKQLLESMRMRRTTRHFSTRCSQGTDRTGHPLWWYSPEWRSPPTMDIRCNIISSTEAKDT